MNKTLNVNELKSQTVGRGANTVIIDGQLKHITDLDPVTLCFEWTKLKNENKELYRCIKEANSGWRGLILRIIGIRLPDGKVLGIHGKKF
ncbi:hypothetical protein DHU27_22920 [Salmonella enterica]|nr:hypothetical protein [Salmonella enterica]